VVSGPNLNKNIALPGDSGTIAAARAASSLGIPGIAFSGATNTRGPWSDPAPLSSQIYASPATNITLTLLNSYAPLLPEKTFLSVNFSPVTATKCSDISQFKYIMTRPRTAFFTFYHDIRICRLWWLPEERWAIEHSGGCFATISLAKTDDHAHIADRKQQRILYSKLSSILSCPMEPWNDGNTFLGGDFAPGP
jgi:5'/3'-nucleotidase SurE